MAARRWLLFAISLASLVILAYGGVMLAFSVGVTDDMVAQSRLPGQSLPAEGTRALVAPIAGPQGVATAAGGGDGWLDWSGALLLVADNEPSFPASALNASLVRALAHVQPDTDGRYDPPTLQLAGIPGVAPDGNVTTDNLSIDVAPLAQGAKGWLVRADATGEIRFVPADRVVGRVDRFEPSGAITSTLVIGAIGFVTPLVILLATHRPSGRAGIGEVICAECRRPTPTGSDFCTGCGAWKRGGGS